MMSNENMSEDEVPLIEIEKSSSTGSRWHLFVLLFGITPRHMQCVNVRNAELKIQSTFSQEWPPQRVQLSVLRNNGISGKRVFSRTMHAYTVFVQRTQRMSISTQLFLCNKTILQIQDNIYQQEELIYLSEFMRYVSNIIMSVRRSLTEHKVLFCIYIFL